MVTVFQQASVRCLPKYNTSPPFFLGNGNVTLIPMWRVTDRHATKFVTFRRGVLSFLLLQKKYVSEILRVLKRKTQRKCHQMRFSIFDSWVHPEGRGRGGGCKVRHWPILVSVLMFRRVEKYRNKRVGTWKHVKVDWPFTFDLLIFISFFFSFFLHSHRKTYEKCFDNIYFLAFINRDLFI